MVGVDIACHVRLITATNLLAYCAGAIMTFSFSRGRGLYSLYAKVHSHWRARRRAEGVVEDATSVTTLMGKRNRAAHQAQPSMVAKSVLGYTDGDQDTKRKLIGILGVVSPGTRVRS
jgi:hypothetical protein